MLICEEWEHARRRDARIHAEIVGYGESFDAYSMMIMEPAGEQLARTISAALEAAIPALSLRDQKVHGCVNLEDSVRPLNFARRATDARLVWAVSQSSALGGHNATVVIRQAES